MYQRGEDERHRLPTLPDHLIFNDILPRLPVKPLIRFNSVCKNLHSTISTPEFSMSHLSFSSSRHQFLLLQKNVRVQSSNFFLVPAGFEIGGEYTWIRVRGKTKDEVYANVGTHILEFNLVREEYEVKPRMKFADLREPAVLMNLKGCLAVHATSYRNCISVWKLKHKDDWNSWEKVVDSKNLRDVTLIYYSTTGKLVVGHQKQLKVVEDLSELPPQGEESRELGKFILRSLPSSEGVTDYVESLISLV